MKSILFVALSLVTGGAEKSLVNLLNELSPDEYDIDLLLFKKEGMFLAQIPEYVNLIEFKPLNLLYSKISVKNNKSLTRLAGTAVSKIFTQNDYAMREYRWRYFYKKNVPVLEKHYDVAIAYIGGEVTYFVDNCVFAGRKLAWVHTDYLNAGCKAECDKEYYDRYNAIVTISEKCKKILQDEFKAINDRVYNVPNITSSVVIRNRACEFVPKEYGNEPRRILSIGRLVPLKRFDEAIRASKVLKDGGYEFVWYLIGNGECEEELRKMVLSEGVTDCFKILGSKENPYPYIKNADIIVQTSRYEGKSVVLDEAKILGIPIVSTNYETVYDQVKNGSEGLIVEMDANSIAKGIEELLLNTEKYDSIKTYLLERDYGNQKDVQLYRDIIEGNK